MEKEVHMKFEKLCLSFEKSVWKMKMGNYFFPIIRVKELQEIQGIWKWNQPFHICKNS